MPDTMISAATATIPQTTDVLPLARAADGTARNVTIAQLRNGVFNASDYGAVSDSYFQDGVSNGTTTFTSNTASFVAGDAGKVIVIEGAGASRNQAYTNTIASVTNSTTVVLATATGRSQSYCHFYISRAGDQLTAIQAAIDACAAAGGGTVLLPGAGYMINGAVILKYRVVLRGRGMRSTLLHLGMSVNQPVIKNYIDANGSAMFCGVMDMTIDGNKTRNTSDASTTLASGYTAGGTTLSLVDGTVLSPYGGSVKIGTNILQYQSITGSSNPYTANTVAGGTEGTTDANASASAAVTQVKNVGIYFSSNPFSGTQGAADDHFDAHYLIQNVLVRMTRGDGVQIWGRSEARLENVVADYCDGIGIRPSFDTWVNDCTSGFAGRMGFYLRGSEVNMVNSKAFYSGNVTGSEGYGFLVEGPAGSLEEGTKKLIGCDAQDNKADGFYLRTASRVIVSGTASSNGTSSVGTYAGIKIDGCTNSIIQVACTERVASPNNAQQNGLILLETGGVVNAGNSIRITHAAVTGSVVGAAIKSGSVFTGGNDISINSMGGTIAPAFATPYTPDPYAGTVIYMGALTNNLTVNAPSNAHLGCELEFRFLQDGTGGRTITWNAAFVFSPAYANTGNTAGKIYRARFRFDGSNWLLVWQSQSATAGTFWT